MSAPSETSTLAHRFESAWQSLAENRWLPLMLLAIGTASNLRYAHTPLVAVAVTSGVILKRRQAITVALLLWLVNQTIGFSLRGYPFSTTALTWGILMGLGTLMAVGTASWRPAFARVSLAGHILWLATALLAGFLLYQGLILLAYPLLADGHFMGRDIVTKLFIKQAIWTGILSIGHTFLLWIRLMSSSTVSSDSSV